MLNLLKDAFWRFRAIHQEVLKQLLSHVENTDLLIEIHLPQATLRLPIHHVLLGMAVLMVVIFSRVDEVSYDLTFGATL